MKKRPDKHLSNLQVYWNAYLFSEHEKRSRKGLFPVRTIHGRLVDQRSLAFCCQHLSFLSVNTNIGVHTEAQQSYNLKRNNQVTTKQNLSSLSFGWLGITQASGDDRKDNRERELHLLSISYHIWGSSLCKLLFTTGLFTLNSSDTLFILVVKWVCDSMN